MTSTEPTESTWSRWSGPALGVGVAVVTFLLLLVPNLDLLAAAVTPDADAAANQLLIDQATRGTLLVGHYSRAQFHHPGPFFLYEQAAGELVLQRWTGLITSRYASHSVAVMAFNALLAGWAAVIARAWTRSVGAALLLPALAMLVNVWSPGLMSSSWMPAVAVMPFLFLLLAASSVAAGRWRDLPALAFAVGCCVHAHLSTAILSAITLGAVVAALWWNRRTGSVAGRPSRSQVICTVTVAAVFALPIALHSTIEFPGELGKYLSYARGGSGQTTHSLADAMGYSAQIILGSPIQAAVLGLAVVVALVARRRVGGLSALLTSGLGLCALMVVVFVAFAWRGVDDVDLTYLGWFGYGIPVLVMWLGAAASLSLLATHRPGGAELAGLIATTAVVAGVLATTTLKEPYRGAPQIAAMASEVGRGPVLISFEHTSWPTAVGLLVELDERGVPACIGDPKWTFMVTDDNVCPDDADGRTVRVVGPGDPSERPPTVLFERDGYAAWEPSG